MELTNDPRTYAIIGAGIEVHRHLAPGFLEPVYQEALTIELATRSIPFQQQVQLPVAYKGKWLRSSYRVDLLCFGEVVVEIKALRALSGTEEAQVINYLKASDYRTGLLLNFGTPRLTHRRFVFTPPLPNLRPSASSADEDSSAI